MISVNGEKVWVPSCRTDLIAGLKRMGVHKVAGVRLDRMSKKELVQAYCRERARLVRRRQMERMHVATNQRRQTQSDGNTFQLELFGIS